MLMLPVDTIHHIHHNYLQCIQNLIVILGSGNATANWAKSANCRLGSKGTETQETHSACLL